MSDARAVPVLGAAAASGVAARRRVARGIVCAACAAAVSAHAQTPSPLSELQYSAGVPLD